MISVTVLSGADRGRSFDLHPGQVLEIGRGAETNTKLRDPTVSRHHCRIETTDGRILLTDLGSSSGTHINGERVDQRLLFPGDTIRIGETQLRIEQPDTENALTVPPDSPSEAGDTTFELGATPVEADATIMTDPVADQDLSFVLGRSIEGYRIVRELARGKTGALFLANDESRNREVAMKIVWPTICDSKTDRKRFKEAMRSMYKVRHPSIVELYRAGTSRITLDSVQRRLCWAALEYVQGPSFRYILDRSGVAGMLDWTIAWRTAIQIAEALEYVHSKGVVHRNISPDNILLSQSENRAKLSDLMIARALESDGDRPTTRGELVGEIAYMPPERTLGAGPLDVRSDIYSLGATLYSVVTGQPPFDSPSIPDLVNRIQSDEVISPRTFQMSISPMFEEVILRCLSKKPAHRYQSATELLTALNKVGQYAGMDA